MTLVFGNVAFAHKNDVPNDFYIQSQDYYEHDHEDSYDEATTDNIFEAWACVGATPKNISVVNQGNLKLEKFLKACSDATGKSAWCNQLTRPNPASRSTFSCTYGASQPHRLIHPDEKTWPAAFRAIILVKELAAQGIVAAEIYNWWRPEPYNQNVGGAAGRHPYGTSVDVRFKNLNDMELAHKQLCKWRKAGRLKAVGYYGSTGLHFGITDTNGNTWGKDCP